MNKWTCGTGEMKVIGGHKSTRRKTCHSVTLPDKHTTCTGRGSSPFSAVRPLLGMHIQYVHKYFLLPGGVIFWYSGLESWILLSEIQQVEKCTWRRVCFVCYLKIHKTYERSYVVQNMVHTPCKSNLHSWNSQTEHVGLHVGIPLFLSTLIKTEPCFQILMKH